MAVRGADVAALGAAFLGRYDLIEKVGEGGFGIVYKARQLTTGQSVAIKVLQIPAGHPQHHVDRLVARFQREMRLCTQLHHPNIVRIMDSGQTDERIVYSVFEFLPGKNLASVLAAEGRLKPVEARHLMMQVLDALACAHAQGVVHRDLKPANIMVVPTGARRNAIVLDFGIGALIEDPRREEARITTSNEWLGTPVYAAPEHLRGDRPAPRSDLYSWGLVFLECLTGECPFQGSGLASVVYKQLSPDPIPLPELIAAHPVGRILKRVLEKNPEERASTADGVLQELEACEVSGLRLSDLPLSTPRTSSLAHTAKAAGDVGAGASPPRASPLPPADAQHTGTRPIEGERRQITALCCTLSVVSDGPGATDIEELDEIVGEEREACTAIARRFGGHVGGALSDTMLFFFGYPSAREDDVRRAAGGGGAVVGEGGARARRRPRRSTGRTWTSASASTPA